MEAGKCLSIRVPTALPCPLTLLCPPTTFVILFVWADKHYNANLHVLYIFAINKSTRTSSVTNSSCSLGDSTGGVLSVFTIFRGHLLLFLPPPCLSSPAAASSSAGYILTVDLCSPVWVSAPLGLCVVLCTSNNYSVPDRRTVRAWSRSWWLWSSSRVLTANTCTLLGDTFFLLLCPGHTYRGRVVAVKEVGCITSVAGRNSALLLIVSLDELHLVGSSSVFSRQVQSCQSEFVN